MRHLPIILLFSILAAIPHAAEGQARERCFSESGYCVHNRFLSYWEQQGALPVFGFPIGDQRSRQSAEGAFSSQWFERERFEAHPENRAPYDVLLGRLGDELLRRRGRDWSSFPKGQPTAGCDYAEATGHTICEPFLSYWRSHGLEFDGRRGSSYEESLALFGLPLSEPAMETNSSGNTVLTQWFERARFEYHPDNPDPYKVLLGRLGAELYEPAAASGATQYARIQAPGWPQALEVPVGFMIEEVASGLNRPRFMALDPANGSLLVAEAGAGRVIRLFDGSGSGRYNVSQTVADGFEQIHSVAFASGPDGTSILFAADEGRLVRFGDFGETGQARQVTTILELPSGSRDLYGHRTRTVAQGPDGKLYLSVGSSCDVCVEDTPRRAAILRLNLDGSEVEIFASGLRNTVGFDWQPESGALWGADMGRNNLGPDLPPDEFNLIERGQDYGWPFCYGERIPNPEFSDAARCAWTVAPALNLPAHWAPLGVAFYNRVQFPPAYQGDALMAFHGTATDQVTNLQGYSVVRVKFNDGKPVALEDLVRGWVANGQVWGRPAGLLVLPDGSLLISDDYGGRIFRLRYTG